MERAWRSLAMISPAISAAAIMALMRRSPVDLRVLFGTLLTAAAATTGAGCRDPGPCTTPYEFHDIDPDLLSAAIADGYIERAECEVLCRDPAESSESGGSSDTVDPTADATTGYDYLADLHSCERIEDEPAAVRCHIRTCDYGRRPAGLLSEGCARAESPIGRLFAEAAHLEAASVIAFERLADALTQLGAPTELIDAALRAADDERRHAVAMSTLADRHGAEARTPELAPSRTMTLLELAIDNAVQGCVGETWSALVAHHQAIAAVDPTVAAIMARIADDETRHGELAWALDAWFRPQLPEAEIRAIDEALATAVDSLRRALSHDQDQGPSLGLPSGAAALALHEGLRRALWAA